ncbi:uncharacterized protein TNCV_984641 [Trichonephila clavipes]|nr:uncharacterized protein TNCV_984641 [Trichonephila clavipes]
MIQICSIGDKSGDQAAQGRIVTVRSQSCDILAVRPGSIPLQSSFLMRGTTPNGAVDGWVSRAAHVMVTAIPNALEPGAFVCSKKKPGPLSGWRPMKQSAIRVHFLRCGGLFDDWSVKGLLSVVVM